jgi:hypothetical protein
VSDERVPPWALRPEVAELLDEAGASEVVFLQKRSDGVVLVAVLPVEALAPDLRELLERRRASEDVGALRAGLFRRWLVALDVDGTTAVVRALGAAGPRGCA